MFAKPHAKGPAMSEILAAVLVSVAAALIERLIVHMVRSHRARSTVPAG